MRPLGTLFGKLHPKKDEKKDGRRQVKEEASIKRLPVLIFPGFMSSSLQVKKSPYNSWIGQRVWLNVTSAGFSKLYFGSPLKQNEEKKERGDEFDQELHKEYEQEFECKSKWLQHFKLSDDLYSDPDGIETRAMEGLEAVNFLDPGGLAKSFSWVFSHVTEALLEAGYREGVNLDAAPYDWRIPPSMLESRDSYFSRTMEQIENMYELNSETPVVLLGHSMGCKTCHYLLNFAKAKRGQEWIDKYVHTYFPVGAPHLGAPKSLRGTITGDKMGMDAFLSDEEAIIAGRSFGSVPWMYSTFLPPGTPPTAYLRREGVLHITIDGFDCIQMFQHRTKKPIKLKLAVTYRNCTLYSKYQSPQGPDMTVNFDETFTFAAPSQLPFQSNDNTIRMSLYEPGLHLDEKLGFCSLLSNFIRGVVDILFPVQCWQSLPFFRRNETAGNAIRSPALAVANVTTAALGSATLVADSHEINLGNDDLLSPSNNPTDFTLQLRFGDIRMIRRDLWEGKKRRKDIILGGTNVLSVEGQCRWVQPQRDVNINRLTSVRVAVPSKKTTPPVVHSVQDKAFPYEAVNGIQLLKSEYLPRYREILTDVYNTDPIGPRTKSAVDAPPVKRVVAIYGINLPTEVGAIYRRRDIVQRDGRKTCLHELDSSARIETKDYHAKDGLILETERTPQTTVNGAFDDTTFRCSGDGTVPYFSLSQCKQWQDDCDVTIHELPKADHREILADNRFLEILLEYVMEPIPPTGVSYKDSTAI